MTVEKYILIQLCFAALFLIVGAIVLTVLIGKQKYIKHGLPRKKPDPIDRFKIVECSNKDDYKFQEKRPEPPPPPPPQQKKINLDIISRRVNITKEELLEASGMNIKNVIAEKYIQPDQHKRCWDISGTYTLLSKDCQNRMPDGRCTSFVCTKIVRFK